MLPGSWEMDRRYHVYQSALQNLSGPCRCLLWRPEVGAIVIHPCKIHTEDKHEGLEEGFCFQAGDFEGCISWGSRTKTPEPFILDSCLYVAFFFGKRPVPWQYSLKTRILFYNLSCPVNRFRMALVPRVNKKCGAVDAAVWLVVQAYLRRMLVVSCMCQQSFIDGYKEWFNMP